MFKKLNTDDVVTGEGRGRGVLDDAVGERGEVLVVLPQPGARAGARSEGPDLDVFPAQHEP